MPGDSSKSRHEVRVAVDDHTGQGCDQAVTTTADMSRPELQSRSTSRKIDGITASRVRAVLGILCLSTELRGRCEIGEPAYSARHPAETRCQSPSSFSRRRDSSFSLRPLGRAAEASRIAAAPLTRTKYAECADDRCARRQVEVEG